MCEEIFKHCVKRYLNIYMQKKKGKRINYKIVHCSSEDPEYPVTELLQQSPEAKGWQNKRFSSYPEIIVIELFETSLINKIAVLSHQSKIATKVEFEIKINETDDWKKLGRISLDSNVNTNFQARQLKQANISDIPAKFIRLILRQNHTNNQNIFNQVGLIGLSFYGTRSEELPPVHEKYNAPKQGSEIDQGTLNRIKELEAKKKRAVQQENYDYAKDIKDEIDRLKSMALQIGSLQERKQEAIRRENYDDAKIINQEIKKLRQGGNSQHQSYEQPKPPPMRQPTSHYQDEEEVVNAVSPISNARSPPNVSRPMQEKPRQQKVERKEVYEPPAMKMKGKPDDDDDRPINVKSSNPYEEAQDEEQQVKKSGGDLQPLNKELYDDCSQHFSVIEEEIMRHIFSKSHTNREKGIDMIQNQLMMTKNRQDFIGACLYVVKNLIDDKIASVLLGTFNLMTEMLKKLKPQQNSYNQPLVDYILDKMSDYLGHVNERIRATVEDGFGNIFPMYHLIGKDSCYKALASIGKRDKPPKILAGRLKALNKLVVDYQLGKDYEEVIRYAVKYADDKNNQVRTGAINLLCSISLEIGYNTLQPYLKNLRPPIIKSIEDKLDESGHANEPQNFDQKPIKPKTSEKGASRGKQAQMELQVGNEFIDIPKKTSTKFVNQEEMCEFCKRVDKRFVEEDYKDMHYFNACPMLIICSECGQGIEVSTLTSHLVGECANSKYYKKCPRCKEAVHQKNYKSHMEKKQCLSAKPLAAANRCPLCHMDISPGVNGWKEHLVDEGCENNPRA